MRYRVSTLRWIVDCEMPSHFSWAHETRPNCRAARRARRSLAFGYAMRYTSRHRTRIGAAFRGPRHGTRRDSSNVCDAGGGGGPAPAPSPQPGLLPGNDLDNATGPAALELDRARGAGVDRVVLADPGALTVLEAGAALANDDLAPRDRLAGEYLHAKALGVRVAPVPRGAEPFLMCHRL